MSSSETFRPGQPENVHGSNRAGQVEPTLSKYQPLRIWPALVLLALLVASRFAMSLAGEFNFILMMIVFMGPMVIAGLVLVWWLFASKASMKERLVGTVLLAGIGIGGFFAADPSMKNMFYQFMALPTGIAGFLIGIILLYRLRSPGRTVLALVAAAIGFGYWDLKRSEGTTGEFQAEFDWRWTKTKEQKFLETQKTDKADLDKDLGAVTWPGFRGNHRDGKVLGIAMEADWSKNPPKEIWKRKVGPSWGSFAMAGNRLFTHEQRGENEVVVCMDAKTGKDAWVQESKVRFEEAVAGAGPRSTPTLHDGKLYTQGATGLLQCLDPITGNVLWKTDISVDLDSKPPMWGFSASPLVVKDVVIVHAGDGKDRKKDADPKDKENGKGVVLAYDLQKGELRWKTPAGPHSYSSPHLATVAGQESILMLTNEGLAAYEPATGKLLWEHDWPIEKFYRVVQPLVLGDSDVLLGTGFMKGTQRITVKKEGDQFKTEEKWSTEDMKPPFNDYVDHKGNLYGFHNSFFACINLETGKKQWRGGRYGAGEVLLLPEADQLLVLSETGQVALLKADSKKLEELARIQAIEGKTWNHPILVGNRLYVRNAEEAACYEMPVVPKKDVASK